MRHFRQENAVLIRLVCKNIPEANYDHQKKPPRTSAAPQ